ncbi:S41 family peptidase [Bacteroides sp.]
MKNQIISKLAFTLYFIGVLNSSLYAQENIKQPLALKANGKILRIIVDGKEQKAPWVINPSLCPDVFQTSAKKVMFRSPIDSISFDITPNRCYDFVVVTHKGDSAMTRIQWVSANPLEEPSEDMLQRSHNGLLSRKQAQFDLDALMYTLGEVHPNMFSVCEQSKLFQSVNMVKRQIPDSVSTVELFKWVAPLVAKIGDGHTMLRFPYNDYFTSSTLRFPLFVNVMPDYTLRVKNCIDNAIPQDAEILSINGISGKDLIKSMMEYVSGERDFFLIERIDYDFPALFEMLYKADKYDVTYQLKNGKKRFETVLYPTAFEEMKSRMPKNSKEQIATQDYSFKLMEDKHIAIMDFRRFNNPKNMELFADSMFLALREKNITNLIIDLRNNGGGNSVVGDILFRYISPKPFQQMGKCLVRITPTTLRLMGKQQPAPGWYFYNSEENGNLITPLTKEKGHYEGNVYLLISHHTFSSAGSFAWAFKHFGMGTVVGEESGGMNVSFGDILSYKLPVSGLYCTISFKRFWQYGASEKEIHGTLPDYEVQQAEALDAAFKLIKKSKK